MPHLFVTGMAVGLEELSNLEFRANCPYRACLICGDVYQTSYDRDLTVANTPQHILRRREWAEMHSKSHPSRLHRLLRISGQAMTPEAANKLAAYGLVDIGGLVMVEEHTAAYAESRAVPDKDADF